MRRRVSYRHQCGADHERLSQGVRAVPARRALDAVQVSGEAHGGAGRPVVPGPEGEALVTVPVPRADHRL